MPRVKLLVNLGAIDQAKYDIRGDAGQGRVVKVNEKQFDALVNKLKCAEPVRDEPDPKSLRMEALPHPTYSRPAARGGKE